MPLCAFAFRLVLMHLGVRRERYPFSLSSQIDIFSVADPLDFNFFLLRVYDVGDPIVAHTNPKSVL